MQDIAAVKTDERSAQPNPRPSTDLLERGLVDQLENYCWSGRIGRSIVDSHGFTACADMANIGSELEGAPRSGEPRNANVCDVDHGGQERSRLFEERRFSG
jgi:hypothetical protein